jgi:type II secretory pathway predicted ATPase ExeA
MLPDSALAANRLSRSVAVMMPMAHSSVCADMDSRSMPVSITSRALVMSAKSAGDTSADNHTTWPLKATITDKRQELIRGLRERLAARRGYIVTLICDEAQRQSKNTYEWLRDVRDQLAYHGIQLITFLVGQPQLLAQKGRFQLSGDEQIVARFMIEQLEALP